MAHELKSMKIGFVGLGLMGTGMASNLLKAGHEVMLYNRTIEKAQALAAQGAKVGREIRDACDADVVISMLANDRALNDVAFSSQGLLASMKPGATHVSMSTISIAIAERLTEAHARAGQHFVSAPVFGRPDAAAAAKLFIVVAGKQEIVQQLQPAFAAMGQLTLSVSENPRDANLVKICGNFMIGSAIEAMGEAAALARKAGIAPQTFIDVMTSTVFNAPAYKNYGALIAKEQYSPAGFTAPLGYKDVGLALEAATSLQVPMPLASLLRDRLLRLLAEGGESLDWSAIAKLSASDAGL
jgi:3-hydroxyisobutyrate dehydrogenase-like beta-hydroxyacid dehydrogenase